VSGTRKYDRGLRQLRHGELHWLDMADRVTFNLCMTVHKCLHSHAPDYLSELCTLVAQVAQRQHLRSASRRLLVVPRIQLETYGRHSFAVIGPTLWNALGNDVRDQYLSISSFGRLLKTHLFQQYLVHRVSALETLSGNVLYKLTSTWTIEPSPPHEPRDCRIAA